MADNSLEQALHAHGIPYPPHAISQAGFTRWGKNGRYFAAPIGEGVCFGDWSTDTKATWFPNNGAVLTDIEKKQRKDAMRKAWQEAEKLRQEKNARAAKKAQMIWERLGEKGENEYLCRKQVPAIGVRFGKEGTLVVPVQDEHGALWSLQFIRANGSKRFLGGGRKHGCFHMLGTPKNGEWIGVAEGYATAASSHIAIDMPVAVAFDAGNLSPVIAALRARYPDSSILIIGDDDRWNVDGNKGRSKAEEAANQYGCCAAFPTFAESSLAKQPTDFNDLHSLEGLDAVKEHLHRAIQRKPGTFIPDCFRVNGKGVFWLEDDKDPLPVCHPALHVVAFTHDEEDKNHGRLLEWKSATTGILHRWAMPCRMLAGEGTDIQSRLLDEGLTLNLTQKAKQKLTYYLQAVQPARKLLSISRPGWHDQSFALPDAVYPDTGDKVLQTDNAYPAYFKTCGTLEEWQTDIARYAVGNPRLIMALCTAFAAPLLKIANEESGAIHFVGGSSLGKTTVLRMAGSVWGGGGDNGFTKQWRATGNALEAIAEAHRDCLLPLDELGQADAKTVGDTVYMLANNQGKGRMKASGALRDGYEWRILVLSTGEITLEDKMNDAGRRPMAGMEVRFVNIPADAETGHGIFHELHGFENGDAFSRHLKDACGKYYGIPIRMFLAHIAGRTEGLVDNIRAVQQQFNQVYLPTHTDGQVKRVAGRFGLIAAAGELATELGILPFNSGVAMQGVGQCFQAWLQARGTTGALEIEKGIAQIRMLLERYGESRFVALSDEGEIADSSKVPDRMGFRQKHDSLTHYYVLPESYRELCKGFDVKMLSRALVQRGYLEQDKAGKSAINKRLPGIGQTRVYHLYPSIFNG